MFKPWESPSVETKPNPFSLDALIAWLRTKPADESYRLFSPEQRCLLQQASLALAGHVRYYEIFPVSYNKTFEHCWVETLACPSPHTFGAALSRALALKAGGA